MNISASKHFVNWLKRNIHSKHGQQLSHFFKFIYELDDMPLRGLRPGKKVQPYLYGWDVKDIREGALTEIRYNSLYDNSIRLYCEPRPTNNDYWNNLVIYVGALKDENYDKQTHDIDRAIEMLDKQPKLYSMHIRHGKPVFVDNGDIIGTRPEIAPLLSPEETELVSQANINKWYKRLDTSKKLKKKLQENKKPVQVTSAAPTITETMDMTPEQPKTILNGQPVPETKSEKPLDINAADLTALFEMRMKIIEHDIEIARAEKAVATADLKIAVAEKKKVQAALNQFAATKQIDMEKINDLIKKYQK